MADEFEGRVVLVTGAGSGIGREAARKFASRGAHVYAAGRGEAGLLETQRLISEAGGQVTTAVADVAVEDEVAAVDKIASETGRLDVAFNNAGVAGGAHRLEDYPTEDFDNVVSVNLRSVFLCMKYELPLMKRHSVPAAICNTASVAALTGPGGMSAYAASKHVHGLTRVAAMENAALNIRVNTLAPGWTETPMVIAAAAQNPAFAKQTDSAIPAKPFPTPCPSAEPQPQSSAVCLTAARTGAPSTGGNAALLTQRGAMSGSSPSR